MQKLRTDRIEWLDLAKGFAIFLIIFGHCMEWYSSDRGGVYQLLPIIYSFHVPLFFFVSGFLFSVDKYKNFWKFLLKIAKTILLPYLTFAIILTSSDAVRFYILHSQDNISIIGDIKGNLLQQHFNNLWFLATLFFVQIISYFICKIKKEKIIFVFIAVFIVASYLYELFIDKLLYWCIDEVLFTIPLFLFGFLLRKLNFYDNILKIKFLPLFLIISFTANYLNLYLNKDLKFVNMCKGYFGNVFLFYISALFAILSVLAVCKKIGRISPINYMGKNSLIYYGLHIIVLTFLFHFLNPIYCRLNNIPHMYIYISFCLVTAVLISLIMTIVNIIFIKTPLCVLIGKKYKNN